jgi:hypothetical protein
MSDSFRLDEDLIPMPMKTRARISRKQTGESIPSLKRSANGRSPGPIWRYAVHFRQSGPGVLPSSPALLER